MSEVANTASGIGGFLQRLYKPIILWVQDVFATKASAMTNVSYDATNKKLQKTINGTTSDVVAVSTLKSDMNLSKSDVGLGNVVNTGDSATPVQNGTTKFTTGGAYTELDKKVDKVNGKGLSTNDYDNDAKGKVDAIPSSPKYTDTDTKVTSVDNHYAPSADANAELTASLDGSEGSYAINTEYSVVTGVKAQRDAKGHITGIKVTKQKVKDTNTHTAPTTQEVKTALGTGSGTSKFLREDGTWQTPPDNDTRGVFNEDTLVL